ncbi:MAG TPA: VCBS repeat-containing protein [Pyrinomonadaceae bacterium]|nr:VCBS repeat-containing protein [Pyrinomonadaceae bacterium]
MATAKPTLPSCPSTGDRWQTYSSTGGSGAFNFGVGTDTPIQADFDGDGKTDAAVFRKDDPSAGLATFYIRRSSDSSYYAVAFGVSTDIPAPADYDGDGRADIGVWRSSNQTFYSTNSSNNVLQTPSLGSAAASATKTVSADYDGDGKADYAVYDPSTANWYIRQSTTSTVTTTQWGSGGDTPVQNDYDGDGKVDLATWANGDWHIKKSTGGTRDEHWGMAGDIPVPAFYRR